jgi:hypothetical protein
MWRLRILMVRPTLRTSAFDPEMNSIRHHDGKLTIDGPNNLIYKFEGCYETRKEDRLIASNEIEW